MNNKVERKLESISSIVKDIINMCECIEMDLEDVTEAEDLFIIESNFERIMRKAGDARIVVRDTEDLFDEED